jgi:hypothetical protein
MSVLLSCDVPNCPQTTMAVASFGRPGAPTGWWMQADAAGRLVVACCEKHVAVAVKATAEGRP